jgi:hypothetical protein
MFYRQVVIILFQPLVSSIRENFMKDFCCRKHAEEILNDTSDFDERMSLVFRMYLCPECGNKRCPKATDCENNCTNSNEPNQKGSIY